jgi:xylan 1,4-beta-xylosidase
LWDQTWHADNFRPFFKKLELMSFHWNQMPHRFGMFGVGEEIRPQYFVYQMIGRLGEQKLKATSDASDVRILAAGNEKQNQISLMLVNYGLPASRDCIAAIRLSGLKPGNNKLTTFRIDRSADWSAEHLELLPIEMREVETETEFSCQVFCPADSVGLVTLEVIK